MEREGHGGHRYCWVYGTLRHGRRRGVPQRGSSVLRNYSEIRGSSPRAFLWSAFVNSRGWGWYGGWAANLALIGGLLDAVDGDDCSPRFDWLVEMLEEGVWLLGFEAPRPFELVGVACQCLLWFSWSSGGSHTSQLSKSRRVPSSATCGDFDVVCRFASVPVFIFVFVFVVEAEAEAEASGASKPNCRQNAEGSWSFDFRTVDVDD